MKRIERVDAIHLEKDEFGRVYPTFIDSHNKKWVAYWEGGGEGLLSWVDEIKFESLMKLRNEKKKAS